MRTVIEFNMDNAAFEDDLPGEVEMLLEQAARKLLNQLSRDPSCICDHNEADEVLLDTNGNTVGKITVKWPTEDGGCGEPCPLCGGRLGYNLKCTWCTERTLYT